MKIHKNLQKSQFDYLEKGALELCHAATTKSRQIERSGFFFYWTSTDKLEFQTGLESAGCSVVEMDDSAPPT